MAVSAEEGFIFYFLFFSRWLKPYATRYIASYTCSPLLISGDRRSRHPLQTLMLEVQVSPGCEFWLPGWLLGSVRGHGGIILAPELVPPWVNSDSWDGSWVAVTPVMALCQRSASVSRL
jgi:hypothetical protein